MYQWYRQDTETATGPRSPARTGRPSSHPRHLGRNLYCVVTASNPLGRPPSPRTGHHPLPAAAQAPLHDAVFRQNRERPGQPDREYATSSAQRRPSRSSQQLRIGSTAIAGRRGRDPRSSRRRTGGSPATPPQREIARRHPCSAASAGRVCSIIKSDPVGPAVDDSAGFLRRRASPRCDTGSNSASPSQPVSLEPDHRLPTVAAELSSTRPASRPLRVLWDIDGDNAPTSRARARPRWSAAVRPWPVPAARRHRRRLDQTYRPLLRRRLQTALPEQMPSAIKGQLREAAAAVVPQHRSRRRPTRRSAPCAYGGHRRARGADRQPVPDQRPRDRRRGSSRASRRRCRTSSAPPPRSSTTARPSARSDAGVQPGTRQYLAVRLRCSPRAATRDSRLAATLNNAASTVAGLGTTAPRPAQRTAVGARRRDEQRLRPGPTRGRPTSRSSRSTRSTRPRSRSTAPAWAACSTTPGTSRSTASRSTRRPARSDPSSRRATSARASRPDQPRWRSSRREAESYLASPADGGSEAVRGPGHRGAQGAGGQVPPEGINYGASEFQKLATKLDLGPFKLTGADAKVELNDDGTATLHAVGEAARA